MYNSKSLQDFIDTVTAKAEKAAQAVYETHADELRRRIKSQLHKDDVMWNANGACLIERNRESVGEKFSDVVAQLQYPITITTNFLPDYKTTKH